MCNVHKSQLSTPLPPLLVQTLIKVARAPMMLSGEPAPASRLALWSLGFLAARGGTQADVLLEAGAQYSMDGEAMCQLPHAIVCICHLAVCTYCSFPLLCVHSTAYHELPGV